MDHLHLLSRDLEWFCESSSLNEEHHVGQRFLERVCEVGLHGVTLPS